MSTYARYQRISELFSVPQLRVASQALELGFITYFQGWFHSESQALFRLWQAVTCIIIITSPSPSPPFSQVTPFSLSLSPSRTHDSTHHSNTHRHPLRFKIQYSALVLLSDSEPRIRCTAISSRHTRHSLGYHYILISRYERCTTFPRRRHWRWGIISGTKYTSRSRESFTSFTKLCEC